MLLIMKIIKHTQFANTVTECIHWIFNINSKRAGRLHNVPEVKRTNLINLTLNTIFIWTELLEIKVRNSLVLVFDLVKKLISARFDFAIISLCLTFSWSNWGFYSPFVLYFKCFYLLNYLITKKYYQEKRKSTFEPFLIC